MPSPRKRGLIDNIDNIVDHIIEGEGDTGDPPRSVKRGRPQEWGAQPASVQRRARRASVALEKASDTLAVQRSTHETSARSLIGMLDGTLVLSAKDANDSQRNDITFRTLRRIAEIPAQNSARAVATLVFNNAISVTTIRNSRVRFAKALETMIQHRVGAVLHEVATDVRARFARASEGALDEIVWRLTDPDGSGSVSAGCASASASCPAVSPLTIVSCPWKFDGTPTKCFAQAGPIKGKGAECFHQRGSICIGVPGENMRQWHVPLAPRILVTSKARALMQAAQFPAIVEQLLLKVEHQFEFAHAGSSSAFPPLIILVPLCVDAAGSNRRFFDFCLNYYAGRARRHPHSPAAVWITAIFCTAHQVHLCSKSVFAASGGTTRKTARTFISRLIGAAHTLANGACCLRLFHGLANVLQGTRCCTVAEASANGWALATDSERQQKQALLEYVASWLCTKVMPENQLNAIAFIAAFLNTPLFVWTTTNAPLHIHTATCNCGLEPEKQIKLLITSFGILLNRLCSVFSEGRWTSAQPSLACLTLWLLPHKIGRAAMQVAFDKVQLNKRMQLRRRRRNWMGKWSGNKGKPRASGKPSTSSKTMRQRFLY